MDEIINNAQKLAKAEKPDDGQIDHYGAVAIQDNVNKKKSKFIDYSRDPTLYFRVIKTKKEVYDIITRSFSRKKNGWSELPHGLDLRNSWNLMWSWSKITIDLNKLLVF